LQYDGEASVQLTTEAIKIGIEPSDIIDSLTSGIRQVGYRYDRLEIGIPELVGAASAMQRAMPIVEEALKNHAKKINPIGLVVLGTVFGDIHNIGKNMVSAFLTANSFKVIDLGVDVKSEQFVEAINKYKPNILAMSALLTTTAPEQRKVIKVLEDNGIRDKVKVMVGGGAVNQDFADMIGADGYSSTAPGAVWMVKKLMGI
jgi:methanogenic corrinoid protein MtbC1